MSKNDDSQIEDLDAETPEETLDADTEIEASPEEEVIPDEDANKPERKKVAALRARHALEDYFESKKIKEALDYLEEQEKAKITKKTPEKESKKKKDETDE